MNPKNVCLDALFAGKFALAKTLYQEHLDDTDIAYYDIHFGLQSLFGLMRDESVGTQILGYHSVFHTRADWHNILDDAGCGAQTIENDHAYKWCTSLSHIQKVLHANTCAIDIASRHIDRITQTKHWNIGIEDIDYAASAVTCAFERNTYSRSQINSFCDVERKIASEELPNTFQLQRRNLDTQLDRIEEWEKTLTDYASQPDTKRKLGLTTLRRRLIAVRNKLSEEYDPIADKIDKRIEWYDSQINTKSSR